MSTIMTFSVNHRLGRGPAPRLRRGVAAGVHRRLQHQQRGVSPSDEPAFSRKRGGAQNVLHVVALRLQLVVGRRRSTRWGGYAFPRAAEHPPISHKRTAATLAAPTAGWDCAHARG